VRDLIIIPYLNPNLARFETGYIYIYIYIYLHIVFSPPLESRPGPSTVLAPVGPSSFNLVFAQAGTESNIHSWWSRKAKTLGDLDQVKFVDIKYRAKRVGGIGMEV
jgi:hypothetical protein